MAEHDQEQMEETDGQGDEQADEQSGGENGSRSGIVETLMHQLGEHRAVLAPVATTAAAAAATYAARKLPELVDRFESDGGDKLREKLGKASDGGGVKGFAAGAASRAFSSGGGGGILDRLEQGGEQEAKQQAEEKGGITGAVAKLGDKLGGKGQGGQGWGRGRRLPIICSIDVAAPVATVYGQWTQFEEMNAFMHRTESVDQEDDETVTWHENIWGRRRHWKSQIVEQVPNERIAWEIKGGGQGKGVITFHELGPRLTRVEVVFDWQPTGLVEKFASGFRYHKRAAKSDLRRFKAFVDVRGEESGRWEGRIEDGEAKGRTRNKRNRKADPVPGDAAQHTESDERKARDKAEPSEGSNGNGNGNGNDEEREAAREKRRKHREQRARQRA
jgi:hypothetical protein